MFLWTPTKVDQKFGFVGPTDSLLCVNIFLKVRTGRGFTTSTITSVILPTPLSEKIRKSAD